MSLEQNNRIQGSLVAIDPQKVRKLFDERSAQSESPLHAVMLQKSDSQIPIERNNTEKILVQDLVDFSSEDMVLDIGCGAGRIADFINEDIQAFYGIDFSSNLIEEAKSTFKDKKNFYFYVDDIADINKIKAIAGSKKFTKVFCVAVLLYLNDDGVENIFKAVAELADQNCEFYLRESISLLPERLTLKDFYSNTLETDYSAIYRTDEELKSYIQKFLAPQGFKIKTSDFFAKKNNQYGETSQKYYLISK